MTAFDVREALSRVSSEQPRSAPPAPIATDIPSAKQVSPVILTGLTRLAEFGMVVAIGIATTLVYPGPHTLNGYYLGAILGAAGLTTLVFQILELYQLSVIRRPLPQFMRLIGALLLVFALTMSAIFMLKLGDNYSRLWLTSFFAGTVASTIAGRLALVLYVRRLVQAGRLDRRTAIVGGGDAAEAFLSALAQEPHHGISICGVFDDRDDVRSPPLVAGYPKLGNVDALVSFARHSKVDLIVFTLPVTAEARILDMLRKLCVLPTDIRLSAHASRLRLRPRSYSYLGSVPVLDVMDRPIADWDIVLKWLFDKVVGSFALVLLSPVLVATAIAVKLDSKGPVLFRQKRYGFNNDLIEVFKFRSMYVDQADATAAKLVTKDDPRVTRVGRFIRKTSLDELPQLFNVVFKGNLSLVGPRPHAVHAKAESRLYDQVVDGYFARHKVKPGITGWAQINGWRGETDTEEKIQKRVEHDLYYIENWSVMLDMSILIATPFALLKSENAY